MSLTPNVGRRVAEQTDYSATTLHVGVKGRTDNIAVFDNDSLEGLSQEIVDQTPTFLLGSIKSYDKETGWGKFRNQEFSKPLPFMPFNVPSGQKSNSLLAIMKAMTQSEVRMSFYIVRSKNRTPIRLVFNNVVQD